MKYTQRSETDVWLVREMGMKLICIECTKNGDKYGMSQNGDKRTQRFIGDCFIKKGGENLEKIIKKKKFEHKRKEKKDTNGMLHVFICLRFNYETQIKMKSNEAKTRKKKVNKKGEKRQESKTKKSMEFSSGPNTKKDGAAQTEQEHDTLRSLDTNRKQTD